ncbi:MAG: hypothetical protein IPP51_00990 [Bacteroidetes bacterium]|nr:hypothetical protein [Bacteroidota bacterium]
MKMIALLKPHGKVYITAEREMEAEFEPYRLNIRPIDMHHVMAFADMYIGDSQTMAAEAGVLGVPFIRYNDFVGRIGYLRELEDDYKLGFGIKPENEALLLETILMLLKNANRKSEWNGKRSRFLKDKINVTDFFVGIIEGMNRRR